MEQSVIALSFLTDCFVVAVVELNRQRAVELDKRRRDVKKLKLSLDYQSTKKNKGPKKAKVHVKVGKCLQVIVLECRDLKKMRPAMRGLNDVYVTIDIDGQTMKTSTVESGGRFPRWGSGSGDLLFYEPAVQPMRMTVRAFDEASMLSEALHGATFGLDHLVGMDGGEDDEIGAHNAMIGVMPTVAAARRADQAEKNKTNNSSEKGSRSVVPSSLDTLMVEYKRQGYHSDANLALKNAELAAVAAAGLTDILDDDPGFDAALDAPAAAAIGEDQSVGQILDDLCVAVNDAAVAEKLSVKAGRDWSMYEWLPLTNDQGKKTGEVRVFMQWCAPPPAPPLPAETDLAPALPLPTRTECQWQIDATVIECSQLTNMAKLGACESDAIPIRARYDSQCIQQPAHFVHSS